MGGTFTVPRSSPALSPVEVEGSQILIEKGRGRISWKACHNSSHSPHHVSTYNSIKRTTQASLKVSSAIYFHLSL